MNESNRPTGQASGRRTAIVIVAAGSGQRLGAGLPKAAVAVGGRSLIAGVLYRDFGRARDDATVAVVRELHRSAERTALP